MNSLDAIILGVVQGATEFIPVSSSAHLILTQHLLGVETSRYFLEFINVGTFLVLIFYFRQQIASIIKDVFVKKDYKWAINIIITAFPAAAVGYLLSDFIDSAWFFNSLYIMCTMLLVIGILMIVLDKLPHMSPIKDGGKLGIGRALIIGLAQVLALVPGVSRSGSTIISGRLVGMAPAPAAEYSFLVSIPLMAGVILKSFVSNFAYLESNLLILSLSNIAAFLVGLILIDFIMSYLRNHSLALFGWYRVGLAAVFFVYLLLK